MDKAVLDVLARIGMEQWSDLETEIKWHIDRGYTFLFLARRVEMAVVDNLKSLIRLAERMVSELDDEIRKNECDPALCSKGLLHCTRTDKYGAYYELRAYYKHRPMSE
jgi:hypothetical protein